MTDLRNPTAAAGAPLIGWTICSGIGAPEVAAPRDGDQLIIGAETWRVAGPPVPDGAGLLRLTLETA